MASTPGSPPLVNGQGGSVDELSVIGINFGNSYASIAVINKEGRADCIANEDGERQIACAVAFNGSETYVGNQALPQLVKNAPNTILGFRNCLGKSFSELTQQPTRSAPLQDISGVPSYSITLSAPSAASLPPTPSPTPPSEPTIKHFSVREVTALFLRSLLQSAQDFLSMRQISGAVLTCPSWFEEKQREALLEAARDAGINVLQLVDEAAAAVIAYTPTSAPEPPVDPRLPSGPDARKLPHDRKSLVLDLGTSSLTLTLLSLSHYLPHVLHRTHTTAVRGELLDDVLLAHFAKDFTKRAAVPLALDSTAPADLRAIAKLRQACEVTKRSLSASQGNATCDVESLKDGMDFHGSINSMRFDLIARGVYQKVVGQVQECLDAAGLDPVQVDEVILVGGSASLPGIADALAGLLPAPTTITSTIEPAQVLAIGCALKARLLTLHPSHPTAPTDLHPHTQVKVTSKPIGIVFPGASEEDGDGFWEVVKRETALPARRSARFAVPPGAGRVGVEVWEGREEVRVEKLQMPKLEPAEGEDPDDEDEEEEDEEEEDRSRVVYKETCLAGLVLTLDQAAANGAAAGGKKKKAAARKVEEVDVEITVGEEGEVRVRLMQVGREKDGVEVSVPGW